MSYQPVSPAAAAASQTVMAALDQLSTADRLLALRSLAVLLGTRRAAAVVTARAEGQSWAEIASRLGMSRQSVWQRYGPEDVLAPAARGRRSANPGFSSCAAYKAVSRRPAPPV